MSRALVILAAGMGRRLGGAAKVIHPVKGYGIPMEKTVAMFSPLVDEIIVVVGFEHEKVIKAAHEAVLSRRHHMTICYNMEYATTNTAYSLDAALAGMHSDETIVVNGDLVFYARPDLEKLVAGGSAALVHPRHVLDEDVKAVVSSAEDGGRITQLGKVLPLGAVVLGEAVGVYFLSKSMASKYKAKFNVPSHMMAYHEDVINELLSTETMVAQADGWCVKEFDSPSDLKAIELKLSEEA